jgi:small subunit ribosomal protein S16
MKQMGRAHRPFYRICAVDKRAPRDGKVLEELGTYDPMVPDTDARVQLNGERVDYWIGVGAQPSEKVAVLIKKYGSNGTHQEANKAAIEKLAQPRSIPERGEPVAKLKTAEEIAAEEAEKAAAEAPAEPAAEAPAEPAAEAPAAEQASSEEASAESPAEATEETTEEKTE